MATLVKMPQLGESVLEGTVARWLKAAGDVVAKFEPLLEISTDKIDTEIPAPAAGILLAIHIPEGQTVKVGTVLATIGEPEEKQVRNARVPSGREVRSGEVASPNLLADVASKPAGRSFISPVVARMVAEHGLELEQLTGTGAGGRITKQDVQVFLASKVDEQRNSEIENGASEQLQSSNLQSSAPQSSILESSPTPDEILQPLTAMRRAIAQHMVQSKAISPHVTTVFEADMTAVVRHREAQKANFAAKGLHLTFTPYFVAAVAMALRAVPQVNSRFSEQGILRNRRIHIGLAVALPDGLLVPVIRDADEKNLPGLTRAVNEVSEQARQGKLSVDALHGGTFTITNHGVGGSLLGTPIINQPQSAILGIGAIVKRPVVRSASRSLLPSADDALLIRPMCYLSLSFDHRVLDGAKADEFMTVIKEKLENWQEE